MSGPGFIFSIGPAPENGPVITLSDTEKYLIEPAKFKTNRRWLEVRQPIITGGERLAYRVLQGLDYSFDIMFRGDNTSYNTAITNYWGLCGKPKPDNTSMFEKAALYWSLYNNDPNPAPPIFVVEQFYDQATPTVWLVTSCTHDEPVRDVIQASCIHVSVKLGLTPMPAGLTPP